MSNENSDMSNENKVLVITRYVTRNGKRIYPKNAKVFAFYVKNKRK